MQIQGLSPSTQALAVIVVGVSISGIFAFVVDTLVKYCFKSSPKAKEIASVVILIFFICSIIVIILDLTDVIPSIRYLVFKLVELL